MLALVLATSAAPPSVEPLTTIPPKVVVGADRFVVDTETNLVEIRRVLESGEQPTNLAQYQSAALEAVGHLQGREIKKLFSENARVSLNMKNPAGRKLKLGDFWNAETGAVDEGALARLGIMLPRQRKGQVRSPDAPLRSVFDLQQSLVDLRYEVDPLFVMAHKNVATRQAELTAALKFGPAKPAGPLPPQFPICTRPRRQTTMPI